MAEEQSYDLEYRWKAFAQKYKLRDYESELTTEGSQEMLLVKISSDDYSRVFEKADSPIEDLPNYALRLEYPPEEDDGGTTLYVTDAESY